MKFILLLLFTCNISQHLEAQTTSKLLIKDLIITPVFKSDTAFNPSDTAKTYVYISFNCSQPDSIKKVYYKICASASSSNCYNNVLQPKLINNQLYLSTPGYDSPIGKYTVQTRLKLPQRKFRDVHYMEVYVEDKKGKTTQTLTIEF